MTPEQYLARVRSWCKRMPETGEKASWGHPNFTAGGMIFAAVEVWKGRPCLVIATSLEEQSLLIEDPHFFRAPYVGKYGWVSALLDTGPDWNMLEPLLRGAYARKLARVAEKTRKPKAAAKRPARANRRPAPRRRAT